METQGEAWLRLTKEEPLEPDLPICEECVRITYKDNSIVSSHCLYFQEES